MSCKLLKKTIKEMQLSLLDIKDHCGAGSWMKWTVFKIAIDGGNGETCLIQNVAKRFCEAWVEGGFPVLELVSTLCQFCNKSHIAIRQGFICPMEFYAILQSVDGEVQFLLDHMPIPVDHLQDEDSTIVQ